MKQSPREFTGKHMLFVMLGFFGVIITVNMTLAVLANKSWTGLVVENSYVASQKFNERSAEGRAQAALGWTGDLEIQPGKISYQLRNAQGSMIPLSGVNVYLHRPTSAAEDRDLTLMATGQGRYSIDTDQLSNGAWIIEITAEAGLENPWRDVRRITLRNGVLQ